MKVTIRKPDIDLNKNIILREIKLEDLVVQGEALMAIDGSTTNTGVSILRKVDGALYYSCAFAREHGETPVQYKVRLKNAIGKILWENKLINSVYYEEPFVGYAEAAKNLLMLRTFIEELIVEREPDFNYLKHYEINNMKWKKLFLAPDKCPQGTELQKAAVRAKLETYMPYMKVVSQDEIDATCMGFIAAVKLKDGTDEELESKKRVYPFQYDIQFIGANEDDGMLTEFWDCYKGPQKILQNGIFLTEIGGTQNFDKFVYNAMRNEDKVLIIKFDSNKHGNLILKYRLGQMSVTYDYIYAVVWRKTRKI